MFLKKLIAKPLVRGVLKSLPVVGEVITNVDSENAATKGKLDWKELGQAIIRLILLFAIIKGLLSVDEAGEIIDQLK